MDTYDTLKKSQNTVQSFQLYINIGLRFGKTKCFGFFALSSRFQNRFRPTYKIAFKTITELEWRCCPGYHGLDCRDLKPPPHRQAVPGIQPYPAPNPGYTTRHTQSKTHRLRLRGLQRPGYEPYPSFDHILGEVFAHVHRETWTFILVSLYP